MRSLLILILPFLIPAKLHAANENFQSLRKAGKILFLGDSITYGGEYVVFFERWLRVNHPELKPEILNQGIPSETISGLSEPGHLRHGFARPDLHERLDRALKALNPDLVIACYGINCGIYQPFDQERFIKYQQGIESLKEKVEARGAEIIFMTPPVYDRPGPDFDYDDVMSDYSKWLVSRQKDGWRVIDLHTVMKKELTKKRAKNPTFKYSRDGVHPGAEGHELMAQQIIGFFAIKPPLQDPPPNAYGRIMMPLRDRMRVLRDAWLTEIGHKRPMRKGKSLDEARKLAAENTKKIEENLRAILKSPDRHEAK
ncbi:MAG: G-D-S-L family lipolytic protein [Verrucomicrobiaceae bacterium]|nr:G-D-S-L family lipolytic protein [Verrucomicrobiaceae bacterium]